MAATVWFSPIGNGTQYLSSAQILALANGGTINTYAAGTSTPQATYTTSAGTVQNATSISLTANGTPATMIWLDIALGYKFIILDALSNQIGPTFDNIVAPSAAIQLFTPLGTGAVTTTVAAKLQQIISVVDRGADPTGVADSTTAIFNASQSNTLTWFPKGTYKVANLAFTTLVNFGWIGAGSGGVTITTTATGSMVKFGNTCNFGTIDSLNFTPTGTPAASSGLELTGSAGNIEVRRCVFSAWTGAGAKATGVIGTQMSGHKFYDCYFLQNAAGAAGVAQLDLTYSNDMMIAGNQIGGQLVAPFSTFGVQMNNCNNCNYGPNNFVWENNVGANINACAYLRMFSNRFEQSQNEGAIFTSLVNSMIQNNWFNNNGLAAVNTYNHARFISASTTLIQGNSFWDWSSGANSQKYAISFETGMTRCTIKGNTADKYATAAYQFGAAMPATSNQTDGALRYSSGATVGAGATTFLMPGGGTTATAGFALQFPDQTHTIVQIVATSNAAPGGGQTFTYTLFKNGSTTGFSVVISGASATQAVANATTVIEDTSNNAGYQIQLVTSGGAAVTAHQASVIYLTR